MKKFTLFLFLVSSMSVFSQSYHFTPSASNPQCPGDFIPYSIVVPTDGCAYKWEVIDGEIFGGTLSGNVSTVDNFGTLVAVKWFENVTGGSMKATTKNCADTSKNGIIRQNSYQIKTLYGVTPSGITGDDNVPPNVVINKTYSVSAVSYSGSVSGAVTYEWEIPSGWVVASGGNTRSIVVTPDNYSGGNIRVRAKSSCGSFYSNWSAVKTITRNLDTPAPISGDDKVVCLNVSTKTYSIPAVAGALSYVWTLPSGWSGSSSSNSITVTPNGLNAGTISVKAVAGSIESPSQDKVIALSLYDENNPPYISGSAGPICSTETYSMGNLPSGASVSWSTSNPSGLTINSSTGIASRVGSYGGQVEIIGTVNTSCGSVNFYKIVWVGSPDLVRTVNNVDLGVGVFEAYPSSSHVIRASSSSPATTFTYEDMGGFGDMSISLSPLTGPVSFMDVHSWSTYGDRIIKVTATNACGNVWSNLVFYIPTFFRAVYPNPAKNTLTLEFNSLTESEKMPDAIEIVHEKNLSKSVSISIKEVLRDSKSLQGNTYQLDISKLERGVWYLRAVKDGKKTESTRLLFE